jgi:beta-N-acetylhexosaminidase
MRLSQDTVIRNLLIVLKEGMEVMNLSRKQKLYQLIISRLDGESISSAPYREKISSLIQNGIGGFIVFGGMKDEVKQFITSAQSASNIPLFIASDIEKGVGQQVEGTTAFPCQMALAAATDYNHPADLKAFDAVFEAVADEAIDIGINMPFIPVLDVNINPDNPIICTRAFSDNPETVSRFGERAVKVLENRGLISCAKHFPGHGDTSIDSHISLPVISKSRESLMSTDIIPFRKAIDTGVSSIMMAHLIISEIDALPASLSKKVMSGLLRDELGYEGLVLTDALTMDALNDFENVPARCIQAGADIILHPSDAHAVVHELEHGVESGQLQESVIDTAVERILSYKSGLKNVRRPEVTYDDHARLSSLLAGKAVTLLKGPAQGFPIRSLQDISLVYSADEDKHDISALRNAVTAFVNIQNYKGEGLSGTVIISLFTRIAAWEGSSGIENAEIETIKTIIRSSERSIVISFGSPYVLGHFSEADVLIAAYDSDPQAQKAVLKALTGEIGFTGLLPVSLDIA